MCGRSDDPTMHDRPSAAAYRERHRIVVDNPSSPFPVCRHDGIRIYAVRGGWRHDSRMIREIARAEIVGTWPR